MTLLRSPIKAAFVLATIFSLLVATSNADVSEACLNETDTIHSTESVLDSIKEVINGTIQLEDPSTCTTSGDTVSCSYDFGDVQSNFDTTCEAADGQVVTTEFTVTCKVNSTYVIEYAFASTPNCIGESCSTSDAQSEIMNFTDQVVTALDDTKGLSDCSIVPASSAHFIVGAKAFLVIINSALLASTFLF
jgi:hypothetical protein